MDRRNIFRAMSAGMAGLFAARARAETSTTRDIPKVVYHLADAEKVHFVLGNIRNHIAGMGGPDKVRIALVVHGPALKSFRASTTNVDLKTDVASVAKANVEISACQITMRAQNLTLADLLPGFVIAERGGVVRLAELQGQGYAYIRP